MRTRTRTPAPAPAQTFEMDRYPNSPGLEVQFGRREEGVEEEEGA